MLEQSSSRPAGPLQQVCWHAPPSLEFFRTLGREGHAALWQHAPPPPAFSAVH
eukprot:NODE_3956_length_858_cov_2.410383_g3283_i0.p7 GENE.NODE_3956_length_858_cov_2.410383_g3283_i0~~NODE_3956_length_858_cov_2.410383_g3283_i0.p7  ORF type:complete len:53 (-),score=3.29 NODE_3956_length_858_cov_2.410383_g3283_i0:210-368(-)